MSSGLDFAEMVTSPTERQSDHITPLLADLHWLRIPQRIQYKLCVLVYQCVQGSAPSYLQNAICPVVSAESRRHRPISSCRRRDVQQSAQDRAFAVAAPRAWNSLPDAIRRSPSLATFKRSSKTHFYVQCFFISIVFITFSSRVVDTVKCR